MAKSITISVNAAQAAVDAINQRLSIYREALAVTKGEVQWDDDEELESDEGTEVQNVINEGKSAADLEEIILNLENARTVLCQV